MSLIGASAAAALQKRQHGHAWRQVPQISGSRWGFIGLICGIFVVVVLFFVICICCICRSKSKKRMRYAAQGENLSTTHPEPTYGRNNTTNKPARRPVAGTQNGGYGDSGESQGFMQQQPGSNVASHDSNYRRNQYAAAGGAATAGAGAAYTASHHGQMRQSDSAANSRYGAPSSYNGGYGGYGEGQGAGYGAGYASEYENQPAAHQHGNYEGAYEGGYDASYGGQQYSEAPVGMAYSHDQGSAYGGHPAQSASGTMLSSGYEGSAAQPGAVQPGAYSSFDQRSQYSHGGVRQHDYAAESQQQPLPNPPSKAAMGYPNGSRSQTPQASSFYHTQEPQAGAAQAQPQAQHFGSQTFEGYGQHGQEGQEAYGQEATGGAEEPPAYYSYDANAPGGSSSAAGPSSSAATAGGAPQGLPGDFQLPPEKTRDL